MFKGKRLFSDSYNGGRCFREMKQIVVKRPFERLYVDGIENVGTLKELFRGCRNKRHRKSDLASVEGFV